MSLAELTVLLERHHGLRVDELTEERLHQALEEGAAATGSTLDTHVSQIAADPVRQQELLDRITLQESSFFRDPPVFADLAAHVLPAAIRALEGRPLVVWCAGCANGQEAWSLVMLLTELGASRFEVVASDLSGPAAERAHAGAYEERELRGLDAARRARFMVRASARWRVADSLRSHVRVVHQNVATEPPPVDAGSCALVLCRYVLIYLTPAAADGLLGRIAAALSADGRLVIGAAESLWHRSERFIPEALPHAVAYRHHRAARAADRAPHRPARRRAPTTLRVDTGPRESPSPEAPDGAALVRRGEAAAAQGDLAAAASAFRDAVRLDPDDAVALVQLGLVLEATDDPGAVRAFRSARSAVGRRPAGELDAALGGFGAAALVRLLAEKLRGDQGAASP